MPTSIKSARVLKMHRNYAQLSETATYLVRRATSACCTTGRCQDCEENSRWERIFNREIADPSYYRPRPLSRNSPLRPPLAGAWIR
jgi:hypothetical protein